MEDLVKAVAVDRFANRIAVALLSAVIIGDISYCVYALGADVSGVVVMSAVLLVVFQPILTFKVFAPAVIDNDRDLRRVAVLLSVVHWLSGIVLGLAFRATLH